MIRFAAVLCALLLSACGNAPGTSGSSPSAPASAQSVAGSESDFSGLKKCPQSGSWDEYLKAEQQSDPTSYETDKADWNKLKAAGANDGYVAAYAANTADCGIFNSDSIAKNKVVYVFVVRFKDQGSAESNYKTSAQDFHVSDSDLAQVQSAGGTITQGTATGLGANSIVAFVSFQGTSLYAAFWQNKQFMVELLTLNEPAADSNTMTTKIDGRIR